MGKYVIGIDLGTTKSVVAIYENGKPRVIENRMGKRITPSFVAAKKDKKTGETQWLVGDAAKNQAITNSLNTIYGVKRLIGRRFDDPKVAQMKALASYKIVKGPNGDAWVEIDGKPMAPAEVSAKVLRELKLAAEKDLGEEVTDAVITCPAYFNDAQIKATKDAGTIAGLNVLRVIKEPTAAALAYGMDKKRNGKVIVYDLGGGTFDVSVLDVSVDEKDGSMIQVLSTAGDTFLGGENFDERVMDHLIEVLKEETGFNLQSDVARKDPKNVQALQSLKVAAEKIKIELSSQEVADVNLPIIGFDAEGAPINFEYTMSRGKLEDLVKDLIEKTVAPCKQALADAGLKISDIDEVLLVGAQTRMPKVVETVRGIFGGKEPRQDASVQEIVAAGASIQGAVLDGKIENVLLLDVIPLSIGIRAAGDVMVKVVPCNSTIPAQVQEEFFVGEDNQPNIHVVVYQGEREQASYNNKLGEFTMRLPPGTKKGTPIEVSFNIDADGVLEVTAKNKLTGAAQKITVQANGGLSDDEVERMLKEAEANADADRMFKERQMAGIYAEEQLKEATADTTEDYFLQAPAELQEAFHATVKELTEAVAKKDVTVMMEKTARLKEVRSAIGEAFYAAATPPADETPTAAPDAAATPDAPLGPDAP